MNSDNLYKSLLPRIRRAVKNALTEATGQEVINADAKKNISQTNQTIQDVAKRFAKLNAVYGGNAKPLFGEKSYMAFCDADVYYFMSKGVKRHGGIATSEMARRLICDSIGSVDNNIDIDDIIPTLVCKGHVGAQYDNEFREYIGYGKPALDILEVKSGMYSGCEPCLSYDDTDILFIDKKYVADYFARVYELIRKKGKNNIAEQLVTGELLGQYVRNVYKDNCILVADTENTYGVLCADGTMAIIQTYNVKNADIAGTRPDVSYKRYGITPTWKSVYNKKGQYVRQFQSYGNFKDFLNNIETGSWGFMGYFTDEKRRKFARSFAHAVELYLEKLYAKLDKDVYLDEINKFMKAIENYSNAKKFYDKMTKGKSAFILTPDEYSQAIHYSGFRNN